MLLKVHWEHWELDHKMTENRHHILSAADISSYGTHPRQRILSGVCD